jgi:CDP-4-dehydro-6-deoxyglucose reductase
MAWKWYDGTVVRIEDQSPTTRRFWVEVPIEQGPLDYRAGQFVTMDLPVGQKRLQRWRSYSIANAPDGGQVLEFCIVRLDGGLATHYLFEEVKPGAPLRFKGPDGGFVLPETIDKDLVLICTGTGVAPFRAMLHDLRRRGVAHRNIHLIFGTRTADGILYREEFEQLQRDMPGFRYSVALSREENLNPADYPFPVVKGYVHELYKNEYAQRRPDVVFYLCGWSRMIDEAVANLIATLGYDRTQVVYELYG